MSNLTAFSWGYWGWGTHTAELVRAVDAVERARGRRPPMFVDIRFSRSVRAPGFRESAFEKTVGKGRYRWLRKLGNARIGSGRGGVKIVDPAGAQDLFELVVASARERRRVIFFCACERPAHCHRAVAAGLLLKAARRNGRRLSVVEWPGGEPQTADLAVTDKVVGDVLRGANRVPLAGAGARALRKFAALPWGSRIRLRSGRRDLAIVSGPEQLGAARFLPVIGPDVSKATDTVESLRLEAARLRKTLGYSERKS